MNYQGELTLSLPFWLGRTAAEENPMNKTTQVMRDLAMLCQ